MEIKDYILFYVNGQARFFVFDDESITNGFLECYKRDYPEGQYAPLLTLDNFTQVLFDGYKLVLRRLSDMTEEDLVSIYNADIIDGMNVNQSEPSNRYKMNFVSMHLTDYKVTVMLCKLGYDLFGIIDAGLAIDNKSI